jgi:hypothetical protein
MGLFSKKEKEIQELPESFSGIQGKNAGKPLQAFINKAALKYQSKDRFPWFLGISIRFKKPGEDGQPSKEEIKSVELLQDELEELIAETLSFRFIGWSDWSGARELIYYVTEPKELAPKLDEFNKISHAKDGYVFAYQAYHDPKWKSINIWK